jgi:hypothetical protein
MIGSAMMTAIKRICRDLGLPTGDSYTQDWAYELPEEFRSYESFSKYLAAYGTPGYGDAEKRLLMQLMLDVTNDLLLRDEAIGYQAWNGLVDLLRAEPELHKDQLEYWALPGEPLEDAFRLTPLVRLLQEKLGRNLRR